MLGKGFKALDIETEGATIHLEHGGGGAPLLLLHGYPQTHFMWHRVAPRLAERYHVICPDLRGYGDSSKPPSTPDHVNYAKRAMAGDLVRILHHFGYDECFVAGHDRGARVTHRMALDHPDRVRRACVMDIAPTYHMFKTADQEFGTAYYHWFFLIQPNGLPERMIGADPGYYMEEKLQRWSGRKAEFAPEAVAEYLRCFSNPETIRASCDDYRAAASIDLVDDEADRGRKIHCPLLVLWGSEGFVNRKYSVLDVWRDYAEQVEGRALSCGHFLPEEDPDSVCGELERFFG